MMGIENILIRITFYGQLGDGKTVPAFCSLQCHFC